jgi:thiamine pyrophosphokinase
MHALVFANGEPPSAALVEELRRSADLVVAADGGAEKALGYGVRVDAIVGDLDSVSAMVRSRLPDSVFHQVEEPDRSDLEKVVEFCIDRGAGSVDIVSAGGGRADHALANLSVLTGFRGRTRVRLIDDLFEIKLVEGEETLSAPVGTVVSLVALGTCIGVTTRGLRWDLDDAMLTFGTRGIHNEVAAPPATVAVREGDLLLFAGRWVEKHQ